MEDTRRPAPRDGQQNSTSAANDEPLLDAVRSGDRQAFAELYKRHCGAVFAVARLHTNSHAEAEDITSEAFTRVLALLQSGGGPQQFLRAYLVTAVSRLAADRANDLNRAQPQEPHEQGKLDRVQLFDDIVVRQVDAAVVARAFASLPERWQEVLWYLEIEGYRPRQVASVVGIRPNAVSALGKRAREGLRTAYMQQHVSAQALEECGEYSTQLGAFVRGTLTPSKMKLMQDHLDSCQRCTAEYLQLQDLGVGLRGWILPVLAGLPLWGDAPDRLIAALGTAGAGSAAGASGVMSATTTPLGAYAPGASVPAAATATTAASATAASTASVSAVTAAAGGVITGSTTKVILAAAGVAVAGTGTAGIVATAQQDSSEVVNSQPAQPATNGHGGGSMGSVGDPHSTGAPDRGDESIGSLRSPAPEPSAARDDPSGIRLPAAREDSVVPQLEVPLTPVLPGPVALGESPGPEVAGPPDNPAEDSSDDVGDGGTPEVPGPVETSDPVVPSIPEVPGPVETPDPLITPVPEILEPVETSDSVVPSVPEVLEPVETPGPVVPSVPEVLEPVETPGPVVPSVPEVPGPVETPDSVVSPVPEIPGLVETPDSVVPSVPEAPGSAEMPDPVVPLVPEVPGTDDAGTDDPGPADPNGTSGNENRTDTPVTPDTSVISDTPGAQPSTPEIEAPATPGAPSLPEEPPLTGPDTEPAVPAIDPTVSSPTVPVTEPTQPAPNPTDSLAAPDVTVPENPSDVTGRWGTVPSGWTLTDWIAYLLTGVRP
ncbi:sigma-70 family RNA polymerase sigma factor [Kocuria sp. cx-455]|uniref:sigma-70 family RNA polymerase sigma factor n=1 Tax=Kocuria sp. cx-455 TaxID=2771377 RepID=UPI0016837960|nr:sigma-70 family RNA polymerase sigma factor [Kocuria sp. cx-455]MBD2764262.1 sigma-70 family RNA polymerase sigma factor [Kocuria sp. cx-455]